MNLTKLAAVAFLGASMIVGCGSSSSTNADSGAGTAGTTGAAGTGASGTSGATFKPFASCADAAAYTTGSTSITTTANFTYAPACLKVSPGATVTIQASITHPLSGLGTGSANNPIPTGGKTSDQTVTFPTAGFYPFQCDVHFSIGMAGVVWVQ